MFVKDISVFKLIICISLIQDFAPLEKLGQLYRSNLTNNLLIGYHQTDCTLMTHRTISVM